MPYFTEPEQALDYFYNLLNTNKTTLGIRYVGYADENILPQYPAVVVSYNTPIDRRIHATRQFQLEWALQFMVYHARLTASHKTRTKEDMQLAKAVRDLLHTDHTLGGSVIFGFVQSERPGILAGSKGQATVATTLIWAGESRATY